MVFTFIFQNNVLYTIEFLILDNTYWFANKEVKDGHLFLSFQNFTLHISKTDWEMIKFNAFII